MADVLRTSGATGSENDTVYILSKAVPTLENSLLMADFCTPAILPAHAGTTARWLLDDNIAISTYTDALNQVTGGIAYGTDREVNEETFVTNEIEKGVFTYGVFIPLQKKDLKMMVRGVQDRVASRLGYLGRLVLDTLIRATVDGSGNAFDPSMGTGSTSTRTSIRTGSTAANVDIGDYITAEDLALAFGELRENDAEPFSNGMFAAVIHGFQETHLITDVDATRINWQEINKYVSGVTGQEKLIKGEVGGITGGMVFRSNNIGSIADPTAGTATTVHENLVLAKDAVGCLNIGDMNPRIHINVSGAQSMSDPHRFYSTVAFQFDAAPALLDSNRAIVLYADAV